MPPVFAGSRISPKKGLITLGRWAADGLTSSGPGMTHEEAWASEARVSLFQASGKVLGLATENRRRIVNR